MRTRSGRKFLTAIVVLGLVGLLFSVDRSRRKAVENLAQLSAQSQDLGGDDPEGRAEALRIIEKVRKLYDLPKDSEPTVAAIVDAAKLRSQNGFYAKAQDGDFLLLTPTRALIYRESEDRLIEVAQIQITPTTQTRGE